MIKKIVKKISTIGMGYMTLFFINHWFDLLLYTPIIAYFGPITGGVIMTVLSIVVNLTLIVVYDKTGVDWLGLEALKESKNAIISQLPHWLQKIMKTGNFIAFLCLATYDPLFAVLYMRKQEKVFKGLSGRDWLIFLVSTIMANLAWTGVIFSGITVFKELIKLFL